VILVDDGIASGLTMTAAILAARQHGADGPVVAIPVATVASRRSVAAAAAGGKLVCLHTPEPFTAIAAHYDQFPEMTDQDVRDLLEQTRQDAADAADAALFDIFAGVPM
jgi:predicted phosphoribosyltransferase